MLSCLEYTTKCIGRDSLVQKEPFLQQLYSVNMSKLILQYYHRQAVQHINEQIVS